MNDEIPVVLMDLPTRVHGFCCLGSDYEPIIIINSRMTWEQQKETYKHEWDHIESGEMDDPTFHEY